MDKFQMQTTNQAVASTARTVSAPSVGWLYQLAKFANILARYAAAKKSLPSINPACHIIHDMFQPCPEIIKFLIKIVAARGPSVNQRDALNRVISRSHEAREIIAILPLCEGK
ncbi:hypothetical protein [Ralstonia syzygii]|uniref:hypothetical protein n=1 Tax=Ralstonia syzygii TaxID=28097 RepID=UPI001E504A9D|nr:hypothetical protein [Ralstonia syzygii]